MSCVSLRVDNTSTPSSRYVVVLTKADKSDNSVSKQVLESVVSALREAGLSRTPVVLTSATSKLGRDGVWRCEQRGVLEILARLRLLADVPCGMAFRRGIAHDMWRIYL